MHRTFTVGEYLIIHACTMFFFLFAIATYYGNNRLNTATIINYHYKIIFLDSFHVNLFYFSVNVYLQIYSLNFLLIKHLSKEILMHKTFDTLHPFFLFFKTFLSSKKSIELISSSVDYLHHKFPRYILSIENICFHFSFILVFSETCVKRFNGKCKNVRNSSTYFIKLSFMTKAAHLVLCGMSYIFFELQYGIQYWNKFYTGYFRDNDF